MNVHHRLMHTVRGYAEARAACENAAWRATQAPLFARAGCTKIPVVVHVVHKAAAENISDAQIHSQIDVLNEDYRMRNADASGAPAVFQSLAADARVEFELATVDPNGNPTTGIRRVQTAADSFTDDDRVKSSATGGDDAWPADQYLNIWVCNLTPWLGYAQFPGGPAATDGVVILHTAFGTTGTAASPFNLGRTATHEIGHWLNLHHIWGDDAGGCSGSDLVSDTPNQGGPNYGIPNFPTVSCNNGPNGDMFMNYMDYVDDAAMVLFSAGQVNRMQATLDGTRSTVGTAIPCGFTGIKKVEPDAPIKKHEPEGPIKKFEPDGSIKKHEPEGPIKKFEPEGPIKKFEPDKSWAEGPWSILQNIYELLSSSEFRTREPDDVRQLAERVARLEQGLAQLTHFIQQAQRPDVSRSPLRNEVGGRQGG